MGCNIIVHKVSIRLDYFQYNNDDLDEQGCKV